MPAQGFWLNRDGKTYGPYSQEQIDAMRTSGELGTYSWLWDGDGKKWVAIAPPSPPPEPGPDDAAQPAQDGGSPHEPATTMISRYPGEQGTTFVSRPAQETATSQVLRPGVIEPGTSQTPKTKELQPFPEDTSAAQTGRPTIREHGTQQIQRSSTGTTQTQRPAAGTTQIQRPAAGTTQTQRPATGTTQIQRPAAGTTQTQRPAPQLPASRPPGGGTTRTTTRGTASYTGESQALTAPLQAICYDERHVMSGHVSRLGADRFYLISEDQASPLPIFKPGMQLWVNLLDEAQGLTENVRCKIANLRRGDGASWVFEMQWTSRPALMSGR